MCVFQSELAAVPGARREVPGADRPEAACSPCQPQPPIAGGAELPGTVDTGDRYGLS